MLLGQATSSTPPAGPAFWVSLAAVVVLSLLIVVAMVEFSKAMLFGGGGVGAVARRKRAWGTTYLLAWAGLVAAFLALIRSSGQSIDGRSMGILAVVVGGWWAVYGVLVWFIRWMTRVAPQVPPRRVANERVAGPSRPPVSAPAPTRPRTKRTTLADALRLARNVVIGLVIVGLAEAIRPLRDAARAIEVRRGTLLAVTIGLAVVGTILLAGGGAYLAVRRGSPMTREEIQQSADLGPRPFYRRSARRLAGPAVGMRGDDEVSFAEMKRAWRARAWRHDPRWRCLFTMAAGALALSLGLCGTFVVVAPTGIKVLVAAAFAYAFVRTSWGFWRA
jgi:hypothetical protein